MRGQEDAKSNIRLELILRVSTLPCAWHIKVVFIRFPAVSASFCDFREPINNQTNAGLVGVLKNASAFLFLLAPLEKCGSGAAYLWMNFWAASIDTSTLCAFALPATKKGRIALIRAFTSLVVVFIPAAFRPRLRCSAALPQTVY